MVSKKNAGHKSGPGSERQETAGRSQSNVILAALANANHLLFSPGRLNEVLPEVLAILGEAVVTDRVYLYENDQAMDGRLSARQQHAWFSPHSLNGGHHSRWQRLDYTIFGAKDIDGLKAGEPVFGRTPDFSPKTRLFLQELGVLALAAVPIFSSGRWWGVLSIDDRTHNRRWSTAEIEALKSVAFTLGAALANDRLYQSEQIARQRSEVMHQVARILSTSLDPRDVLTRCLDQLGRIFEIHSATIYLFARKNHPAWLVSAGHEQPALTEKIGLETLDQTPIVQQMQHDLKPILSPDVRQLDGWMWMKGAGQIRSFMAAPLILHGEMIGILMIDNHKVGSYTEFDLNIVNTLAQSLVVALHNADLFEETQQQTQVLSLLNQIALTATSAATVDELLQQTTEIVSATLYPEHFGFLLLDETGETLSPHASFHGVPSNLIVPAPLTASLVGKVVKSGQPIIVSDVRKEPLYFERTPETLSETAVPLRVRKRIIGVINVESSRVGAFSERDVQFLITLAGLVSTFIERAELFMSITQQADNLANEVARQTENLRAEKERLQTILDGAGEGIIFTDADGTVIYANPAVSRLTGFHSDEILGNKSNLWRSEKTPVETYRDLWQTILRGECWTGELINRTKDGRHYDARLVVAPIFDEMQKITGFVGIQSDISRLKDMDRLKSRFITDVSHELRTPVTNLKLYLDLLAHAPAVKQPKYQEVLEIQVNRLERLVEDILSLSRLEIMKEQLQMEPVDLNHLVSQVIDSHRAQAAASGLELEYDPGAGLPHICGDSDALNQAFANLVLNAVNFTPAGHIRVSTRKNTQPDRVELRLEDTGVGIDAEERPYIFDRFFRGKYATHSSLAGSGLGLTFVKEILDLHESVILIESEPDQGTVVTLFFKTAGASAACAAA